MGGGHVKVTADPRLFARFDANWRMAGGSYKVAIGENAGRFELYTDAALKARIFGK